MNKASPLEDAFVVSCLALPLALARLYGKLLPIMKTASRFLVVLLGTAIYATPLCAQEKVAEGEYQVVPSGSRSGSNHWVLTTRPSGGYLVRSEIQRPAEGIRVVQSQELNEQLVPASVGYELYLKGHTEPDVSMRCGFAANVITCDGQSEKGTAPRSKPYPYKSAFLLAVRELSRFDFAWLAAGLLNMAHLNGGKTPVRTIRVAGGAALELTDDINIAVLQAVMTSKQKFTAIRPQNYTEWEFISADDDVEMLAFVATEDLQLNGNKVAARHYSLNSSGQTLHFWIADPGILLKLNNGDERGYVLTSYKQYKKLIPAVSVETQPNAP
jgi:hypothetical protein